MSQVRIFACAGAGLALATLGWLVVAVEGMSAGILSRSAGLALFGVAMLAAVLVFRGAIRSGKLPAAPPVRTVSEFRRGFDKRARAAKPAARRPSEKRVVLALRRAVAEEAKRPQAESAGVNLSPNQIERIRSLVHARAAAPRVGAAEQAKRRFLRDCVDVHGLAGD